MIVAITGHRSEDCESERVVRSKLREGLLSLRADCIIIGGANGVDLWAGAEAIQLDVELWFAKPWTTHAPRKQDQGLYQELLDYAVKVSVVVESDKYPGPWVYQKRNEFMVDNSEHLLAYWSGKRRGGTFNCVEYADSIGRRTTNVY